MDTPFFNAVVPMPSGAPAGGASESGSQEQSGMGADPLTTPFTNGIVSTPGQGATANQSGLPPQVEIVAIDGAPSRGANVGWPSMAETPKNPV